MMERHTIFGWMNAKFLRRSFDTYIVFVSFDRIRLLLLVMLPSITIAVKCSSRFYCKTTEVKYLAMEEKPGALLNVTAVKTYHAKDLTECQTFCIRENSCQSINLNMSKPGSYECQLLNVNMYSNASFLVTSKNFLHLHIPVSTSR